MSHMMIKVRNRIIRRKKIHLRRWKGKSISSFRIWGHVRSVSRSCEGRASVWITTNDRGLPVRRILVCSEPRWRGVCAWVLSSQLAAVHVAYKLQSTWRFDDVHSEVDKVIWWKFHSFLVYVFIFILSNSI